MAFHTVKETTFFPRGGMWGCARDYARNVGSGYGCVREMWGGGYGCVLEK